MKQYKILVIVGSTVMCLLMAIPAEGQKANPGEMEAGAIEPTLRPHNPRYLLKSGDVMEISFPFTPEFNQSVQIQPDGYINLKDVADMYVEGKTTPELTKMLEKAYARILHEPVITVQLKEFEKPYYIVGGELDHPGRYDLRGTTTLLQALQSAGFRESARRSQVLLFHRLSDQWTEVKTVDVKKMLASKDLREDIPLHSGDLIYVPQNKSSKIKRFIPTASLGAYIPVIQ